MKERVVLDSDILIDIYYRRKEEFDQIMKIMKKGENKEFDIYVYYISFSEVCEKIDGAVSNLLKIKNFLKYIFNSFSVVYPTEHILQRAFDSQIGDINIALKYYGALEYRCSKIITKKSEDYRVNQQSVEILTPKEFIGLDL